MNKKRWLPLSPYISSIFFLAIIAFFLLSSSLWAITESDKGTIVTLPDDAYHVSKPFMYVVQPGDNLHWLAAKFYGDARQWIKIYDANKKKLRNPNILSTGQQLTILSNI